MTTPESDPVADAHGNPFPPGFLDDHRDALVAHARWLTRGRARAPDPDDVVQTALLGLCVYLRGRQEAAGPQGLLTLARRFVETALSDMLKWQEALKRRQEKVAQPMPPSSAAPAGEAPGPVTAAMREERARKRHEAVQQALEEVDPLGRKILELRARDEDQFTYRVLGRVLGMQEDAIRMRHRRALASIKPLLLALLADDSELG